MSQPALRRTLGIDLGTTNSVIACLDDASGTLLTGHDEQGRRTLPSVVAWDPTRERFLAGHEARAMDGTKLPLSSVKRFMGLDRAFEIGPRRLTPPEVSALLLDALRGNMARVLDARHRLDSAVITMPAYFNHGQIEATREAGEKAGYEVRELLHEPTAAAIYYSWLENHGDATYLVYDLGGGTFDVSIIRRRLGDHEVLAVSGDPFLGGDDFDRALATHLLQTSAWRDEAGVPFDEPPALAPGGVGFARLVRLAETLKMELSALEGVTRTIPRLVTEMGSLSLEVRVTRADFQRLLRDKVSRTIDCCHEALGRTSLRIGEIDHVVLVGGSSRVPLVRQVVREAFANPALSERVKSPELLCHEPDLCVAYGAALRAASHGTRYLFPVGGGTLELHVTSPSAVTRPEYVATGVVRAETGTRVPLDGASVRIGNANTGLVEEAFLDARGVFEQPLELAQGDNPLDWTLVDADGLDRVRLRSGVQYQPHGRQLGRGVLPTQLITRALAIVVLSRGRQRQKQVVAPIGAPLPGNFRCVCRTADQSGRVVVPIYEDHQVIKQLVLENLDVSLPIGSPVEVEFRIDASHRIEVAISLRSGSGQRTETATIEPPPPPSRPTAEEIAQVMEQLERQLNELSGRARTRIRNRSQQVYHDLLEALGYDDEAKAIARMAELRDLLGQAERARTQVMDPPWSRFAALVRQCQDLAGRVSEETGRDRSELVQHIEAQERYAEQAHEEFNPTLYRECWENLSRYAEYLEQLLDNALPQHRPTGPKKKPRRPPEEEAREAVDHFRKRLSVVWKEAREKKRADIDYHLGDLARAAAGLSGRMKDDPVGAIREARKLTLEVDKLAAKMADPSPPSPDEGLLEGSA
jgi:molecular chaperone DnaK